MIITKTQKLFRIGFFALKIRSTYKFLGIPFYSSEQINLTDLKDSFAIKDLSDLKES